MSKVVTQTLEEYESSQGRTDQDLTFSPSKFENLQFITDYTNFSILWMNYPENTISLRLYKNRENSFEFIFLERISFKIGIL